MVGFGQQTRSGVAYGVSRCAIRHFLFVANGYRIKSNGIGILGDGIGAVFLVERKGKRGAFPREQESKLQGGSLSTMTIVITIIDTLWRGSLFRC